MTCNICCDDYNKSNRSLVECPFDDCKFQSCKTCVRTYILGNVSDPHCMNCKNPFGQEFLVDNLNKSFIEKQYRTHRKTLLTDKAVAKTQELMPLVQKTIDIEFKTLYINTLTKERSELNNKINHLSQEIRKTTREISNIKNGDCEQERRQFVMPCPADNCKGYLSQKYKCAICELYTCRDCFEVIGHRQDDPHVCNPDCLKNAEAIKRDTKPCPKCGVRIFKIIGCDQMWCTECKVTFSWNTGKIIITQNIHNPHYYEFMKKNREAGGNDMARNPGDVLCGGLIQYNQLNIVLRCITEWREHIYGENYSDTVYRCDKSVNRMLLDIHRIMTHFNHLDLINLRHRVTRLDNDDQDTIKYIRNLITREELASLIIKNDNIKRKSNQILHIYELVSIVSIEGFNSIYNKYQEFSRPAKNRDNKTNMIDQFNNMYSEVVKFIEQFHYIMNYSNYELARIGYNYNLSVIHFVIYFSIYNSSIDDYKKYGMLYKIDRKRFSQTDISELQKYNNSFKYLNKSSGSIAGPSSDN